MVDRRNVGKAGPEGPPNTKPNSPHVRALAPLRDGAAIEIHLNPTQPLSFPPGTCSPDLRQQRSRPVAQHFGQLIGECSWLEGLENSPGSGV
jgi:hypothetical protein